MASLFLHSIMLYDTELVGRVIVLKDDDVGEGEGRRNTKSIRTCRGFLAYVPGDLGLALCPLESLRYAFLTDPVWRSHG